MTTVLVTGGTGFVGSAVVRELVTAGHSVLALARSERSAQALTAAGAVPVVGSLQDLDVLRDAARPADAVVHIAFDNSGALQFVRNARVERKALRAIGDVLAGSDRPLVAAAGFAPVVAAGPLYTELDPCKQTIGPFDRNVERTMMRLADDGVNASVVRLPCVHGDADRFTLPRYIGIARAKGVSAYVGDGSNRWPAVHVGDAARVFRGAVERAVAGGRYHAVAEEGVPHREVAEVMARRLGVPAVSLTPRQARRHFGFYAGYAAGDGPASSAITRAELGWQPVGLTLLDDLDRPEYFPSER